MEDRGAMRLNYKLWLEDNGKVFGEGPCDILYQVDQLGSLRRAAERFNMSYSKAWAIIKKLEGTLGIKILQTQIGGSKGGGSTLTKKGRLLMEQYRSFQEEAEESLGRLEEKWFNREFWKSLQ